MMSNITLCWELGSGYGHIARLQTLAHKLTQRKHTVNALLRETTHAADFFKLDTLKIESAPLFRSSKKYSSPTINYADIIQRLGYKSISTLLPLVKQWREKFIDHKTELIIADHSPTALLAARTLGIPATDYGTGFFSPPAVYPLPTLTPWFKAETGFLEYIENQVLVVINEVLRNYSKKELSYLYELFEIEENFLCTFSELDHYSDRSTNTYWGPGFSNDIGITAQWPNNNKKNIFAYLHKSYQFLDELLLSLEKTEENILVHCAGLPSKKTKAYAFNNVMFCKDPIKMKSLAGKTNFVVNHSGHGSTATCLLMGIPQLLLPMQLEQMILANKLKRSKLCETISIQDKTPNYVSIIKSAIQNTEIKKQTKLFSNRYCNFDQQTQIEKIVLCCETILAEQNKDAIKRL